MKGRQWTGDQLVATGCKASLPRRVLGGEGGTASMGDKRTVVDTAIPPIGPQKDLIGAMFLFFFSDFPGRLQVSQTTTNSRFQHTRCSRKCSTHGCYILTKSCILKTRIIVPPLTNRPPYQILPHTHSYFHRPYSHLEY